MPAYRLTVGSEIVEIIADPSVLAHNPVAGIWQGQRITRKAGMCQIPVALVQWLRGILGPL
jgi:hypothetical protein